MTQEEFERRFDRTIKFGLAVMLIGTALAILIGVPALLIADNHKPFLGAMAVVIAGGCICAGTFAHDIFCNPRWKR